MNYSEGYNLKIFFWNISLVLKTYYNRKRELYEHKHKHKLPWLFWAERAKQEKKRVLRSKQKRMKIHIFDLRQLYLEKSFSVSRRWPCRPIGNYGPTSEGLYLRPSVRPMGTWPDPQGVVYSHPRPVHLDLGMTQRSCQLSVVLRSQTGGDATPGRECQDAPEAPTAAPRGANSLKLAVAGTGPTLPSPRLAISPPLAAGSEKCRVIDGTSSRVLAGLSIGTQHPLTSFSRTSVKVAAHGGGRGSPESPPYIMSWNNTADVSALRERNCFVSCSLLRCLGYFWKTAANMFFQQY